MSGQVYNQWSGYDEYGDKYGIDFHAPRLKINELDNIFLGQISGWLVEH